MHLYPTLDLQEIEIEPQLARRLPYGMATYYRALPVAQDDGAVTVAMAHPENATAVDMIADQLHAHVVPVQGDECSIQAALNRFHPDARQPENRVVAWGSDLDHSGVLEATAARCAERLGGQYVPASKLVGSIGAALALASSLHASLAVLGSATHPDLKEIMKQAGMPFLLVGKRCRRLRRILLVMRGYASDESCAEWIVRLGEPAASVTVLPVLNPSGQTPLNAMPVNGPFQQHLNDCLSPLYDAQIDAAVTFRTGSAIAQIAGELAQTDYDLLTIAGEGRGIFVSGVLAELQQQRLHTDRPVLIIRPQR